MKQENTLSRLKRTFIGDRAFYKMVLAIVVPIIIQNGISNFVGMLDNIMVGQIGTEQMSGVAIVNQLLFVYMLCIFGGIAGAGIFTAQYFGQKDNEGIRHTFRYKIWIALILNLIALFVFLILGDALIKMYLSGNSDGGNMELARGYGRQYLLILLLELPPFTMVQIYASTLRECGETKVPMKAGIAAVAVNLVLNYLLIYGKLGLPQMGVAGAAVATVVSRYVEAMIVMTWTHRHPEENPYISGMYRTLLVPWNLAKKYFFKGLPLLINETLWAAGMAMLAQCYSLRGLSVVAGLNIANTVNNVFNVVFVAMGDAIAIVVGQLLGAGKMKEARDSDNKLIVFSVFCCTIMATAMFLISPLFPRIYNTTDQVRTLATQIMMVQAVFMPQAAFMHAAYFTLRSGGKTIVTFLFDSVFVWCVSVPIAYILSRYTHLHMVWILVAVQVGDWLKCIIGFVLVKKGVWLQNIVGG
ncbi:MAG: MATE family efflux transporter [Lachnospiraceae bacterium]|nr:MATE family efflux transporter [Lachnospiraceae bacterium]